MKLLKKYFFSVQTLLGYLLLNWVLLLLFTLACMVYQKYSIEQWKTSWMPSWTHITEFFSSTKDALVLYMDKVALHLPSITAVTGLLLVVAFAIAGFTGHLQAKADE